MDKNSLLYQLMAMRTNGILNEVAEQDEDYQAALSLGQLAYLQGFCDCRELLLTTAQPGKGVQSDGLL